MRFFSMTLASFKMTMRNKQALFFSFIFPLLFIGLFGIIFGNEQGEAKLAIVDADKSAMAKNITTALKNVDQIKSENHPKPAAMSKLKKGEVDAVVVLDKGFADNFPKQPADVTIYYDPSSTRSQMMQGTIGSVLSGIERSMVKTPPLISIKHKSTQAEKFRYIDFLLPGVLAMSLMNSGLYGIANATVSRREKGVLRRLKLTPMPLSHFIGAGIINQVIICVMQTALLLVVGYFLFDVKIAGNLFNLFIAVLIGSLCFITFGFSVASFAKTADAAAVLGNIIGMPMMFLGGVFFPVDNVPAWLAPIIKALPLKYLADSFRSIMIQGETLAGVQSELFILLGITAGLFLISVKFFRWE